MCVIITDFFYCDSNCIMVYTLFIYLFIYLLLSISLLFSTPRRQRKEKTKSRFNSHTLSIVYIIYTCLSNLINVTNCSIPIFTLSINRTLGNFSPNFVSNPAIPAHPNNTHPTSLYSLKIDFVTL